MTTQRRQQDIRRVAKILRDGNYTYDQSKDLFKAARQRVGLQVAKQKKGSVDRLTKDEFESFLNTAYSRSGVQGLLIRTLLETGSRVSAFSRMRVEDISFSELEIRITDKGDKTRDVPILRSLANELRLHRRPSDRVVVLKKGLHISQRLAGP